MIEAEVQAAQQDPPPSSGGGYNQPPSVDVRALVASGDIAAIEAAHAQMNAYTDDETNQRTVPGPVMRKVKLDKLGLKTWLLRHQAAKPADA